MSVKMKKNLKYSTTAPEPMVVSEATASLENNGYARQRVFVSFDYNQFKAVADLAPFTQAEWADLLFLSERTLQRYAKENSAFSGLHAERILQLAEVVTDGNRFLGTHFHDWLQEPSFNFNGDTPFNQLFTYAGITSVRQLLGRLQHGIVA
jgi:putative toxin-antitoxin system antitoxin component (TIGR02293 family)